MKINAQPEEFTLASFGLDAETEAQLREQAWNIVIRGEANADEFVDAATEEGLLEKDVAERVFQFVLEARRRQLGSWLTLPTTALTRAFEELDSIGIVARQDFSCCGSCGASEIWDERPEDAQSFGYVFFDLQSTESLLESNEVHVSYGAFPDSFITEAEWSALDEKARDALYAGKVVALMNDVVFPVFRKHNIDVEWNNDLGKKILLRNVEYFAPV